MLRRQFGLQPRFTDPILLTIKVFARREEFVCDAAKDSASLIAFWLRLRRAMKKDVKKKSISPPLWEMRAW